MHSHPSAAVFHAHFTEKTKSLLLRGSNPGLKEVGQENVPPQLGRLFEDSSVHFPSVTLCESMDTPPYCPPVSRQQGILKYFGNRQDVDVVNVPMLVCGSCHSDGVELVMMCGGCGRSVCGVEECLRECMECSRRLCQCCSLLE